MDAQSWISIAAVASAVVSYFVKNFVLEPVIAYRKVKGGIQNKLKFYGNKIFNTGFSHAIRQETSRDIRQLSCDLEEAYYSIGAYKILSLLHLLPSSVQINEAAKGLMFISNSIGDIYSNREKHRQYDIVIKNLNISVD